MSRVKLKFPDEKPLFTTRISVRIGDVNYGGHVGNDAILSIMHEARMRWLRYHGCTELDVYGDALIMADVMIAYKGESFYGDELEIVMYADELTGVSFDLLYHIAVMRDGRQTDVAHAKTGMLTFDYDNRKIVPMKDGLRKLLSPGS